jgi:hypothetical protein
VPPVPRDVLELFGLTTDDVSWVRLRSSLGSIVGETFVVAVGGKTRLATRASALDPLAELDLDDAPTYEETASDAAVLVPRGGARERLTVGYLERDEVRAFFVALESPPVAPRVEKASGELDVARAELIGVLAIRAAMLGPDWPRARFLGVLHARVASRKRDAAVWREGVARRSALVTESVPSHESDEADEHELTSRARAESVVAATVTSTTRLDVRIGRLRKARKEFEDPVDQKVFDIAIAEAQRALAVQRKSEKAKPAKVSNQGKAHNAEGLEKTASRAVLALIILATVGLVIWKLVW